MIRIRNLSLSPDEGREALLARAAKRLHVPADRITGLKLYKRSIDARKMHDVRVIYTVDLALPDEAANMGMHSRKAASRSMQSKNCAVSVARTFSPRTI